MQRALRAGFGGKGASDYQALLGRRVTNLVHAILQDAGNQDELFDRFSASMIVGAVYGLAPSDVRLESVIEPLEHFVKNITAALLPGAYLVEFFPIMRHAPLWMAKWKRDAIASFHESTTLFETLLADVEKRKARTCYS